MRILLDNGSQRSYVTDHLKERLGLEPVRTETLNLNTFGDERVTKQRCQEVRVKLQARPENLEISALTFPKICSPLSMKLDVAAHSHLHGLELADSSLVTDAPTNIDILIGSDHYFDVVIDEIRQGEKRPVAINTLFGWVISGPTHSNREDNSSSANLIITREDCVPMKNGLAFEDKNESLTNEVRRFWNTESLGICNEKVDGDGFLKEITHHMLRVTAMVRRCARRWRNPSHKFDSTAQELHEAERIWIKSVQENEFQKELQYLRGFSKFSTPVVTQLGLTLALCTKMA